MSMRAYGWVERCSDVAGCGILHQKISAAGYFIFAIISIVLWIMMNMLNDGNVYVLLMLYIDVIGIMNSCMLDYASACVP